MAKSFTVSQGQAWDQVAKTSFGSEKSMAQLLSCNADEMDTLLFAGEIQLDIPAGEMKPVKSLPPWERM